MVIDAGHGGEKDPGATSNTGIQEKDLVLAFAKEIKALNTNDAIDIVLARENDIYLSPKEKAELAIRNNADLLISLHVDKNPTSATETGISFFVAKNQYPNAPQSKILATALINAFTTNYPLPVATLPKQRNVGIWILQAVNVPSVLIEAGFISNENDVKYLQSKVGKETIAQNILKAINTYLKEKTTIHTITNTDTIPEKSKLPTEEQWKKAMPSKDDTTLFKSSQIKDYTYSPQLIINDNNSKALYIINGKEVVKNELDEIDPERITDVRVLKGATATQIYGDKGKNGVVIVNIKPRTGGPFADKLIANDDDLKKLGKNPYIEVDGKIYEGNSLEKFMLATGINRFSSITIYGPDEAIKKFGNKAVDGAVIAITKKDQLKADFRNPQFYVGNLTGGRKELTLLKSKKK
ncbi:MAG: N-acetylmuramoyl-L-alanine amidase [Chitinophagaceae bacterium]|nr:N-acetylmuramoyl-L-alanine amidase [Chitinophagaceae bacterium]